MSFKCFYWYYSKRWNPDYLLEIRDQTIRNDRQAWTVISSSLTVIIFNKDFDLILKESHASFIRFLDTSFSNLFRTTPPVTVHKLGFSPFVPNASVNPERKDLKKTFNWEFELLFDVLIGALSILVEILVKALMNASLIRSYCSRSISSEKSVSKSTSESIPSIFGAVFIDLFGAIDSSFKVLTLFVLVITPPVLPVLRDQCSLSAMLDTEIILNMYVMF